MGVAPAKPPLWLLRALASWPPIPKEVKNARLGFRVEPKLKILQFSMIPQVIHHA